MADRARSEVPGSTTWQISKLPFWVLSFRFAIFLSPLSGCKQTISLAVDLAWFELVPYHLVVLYSGA